MTFILLLVVVMPFFCAVVVIIEKAPMSLIGEITGGIYRAVPPQWLERIPVAGTKLVERWRSFNPWARRADHVPVSLCPADSRLACGQERQYPRVVIQFLLTVIIAAVMYSTGETAAAGILRFSRRLGGQQGEDAAILAAKAVRGVALGIVVTAILQATIGASVW